MRQNEFDMAKSCNAVSILLVEDDDAIRSFVSMAFDLQGYTCQCVPNGMEALSSLIKHAPDVVLLDLGLPDMDGTELIERIRLWSQIPIIVLSARSEDVDKIKALDSGADDYLIKPFSIEELFARVRVALRHAQAIKQQNGIEETEFSNGGLYVNYASGEVRVDGEEIHLTPMEYQLLCLLARNVDKVLTHNYILNKIWGSSLECDKASLRVFMATLRKKIEQNPSSPCYIQTHVGVGYRMKRCD